MLNKTRVILFGAGLVGREVLPKLGKHVEVLAFADNDPNKQGSKVLGVDVIPPSSIPDRQYDLVLITSTAVSDIHEQLLRLGIPAEKLLVMKDAEAGSPEFPWDAVLFLVVVLSGAIGVIVYLAWSFGS